MEDGYHKTDITNKLQRVCVVCVQARDESECFISIRILLMWMQL